MNSPKRHILFLSSWYPNRIQPTLGNFVQKHAEAVARLHQVSALHVVSDPSLSHPYEICHSTQSGVSSWNIYFKPSSFGLLHGLRYFHAHRLGWKKIREQSGKPDLVHHNILFPAGIFALYLKWFHGLKYLVTENWTGYLPQHSTAYRGGLRKFITRLIARSASLLTPVSVDLSNAMRSHGFDAPHEIVYNVVDTECFVPGSGKSPVFTFLHISTLVDDHKNISGILNASQKLKGRGVNFRVVMAGDGDHHSWKKKADEMGMAEITEFGGEMSTTQVADRMKQADCFLLFSNYENLPCVMVEAMSAGLPVIVTRVGGMPEHVSEERGLVVEAKDESGLEEAMNRMIQRAGGWDRKKIREYAVAQFSYEAVGKKFSELYSRLLS